MENISLYKDGNRLIITIENCSESLEMVIAKMLHATATSIAGVQPAENKESDKTKKNPEGAQSDKEKGQSSVQPKSLNDIRIKGGRFDGLTIAQSITVGGQDAVLYLSDQCEKYSNNKQLCTLIKKECAAYLAHDDVPLNFVIDMCLKMYPNSFGRVLEKLGYSNYGDLLMVEDVGVIRQNVNEICFHVKQ